MVINISKNCIYLFLCIYDYIFKKNYKYLNKVKTNLNQRVLTTNKFI